MFSPYSLKKSLPLGVVLLTGALSVCSQGQTVRNTTTPAPTDEEARFFLQQALVQDSCDVPLSLKVQSATTEEVAALVQKKLTVSDKVPVRPLRVEARKVLPARLSFDAKNSTVGGVLESAAMLAGAKLWILPHLLLMAPQSALTADELKLASKQAYYIFPGISPEKMLTWDSEKAFISFVKKELAALPSSPVAPAPKDGEQWTTRVSFGQFSPDAQAMLRELTQDENARFVDIAGKANVPLKPMVLSGETAVGTTSNGDKSLRIFNPGLEFDPGTMFIPGMGWDDKGMAHADLDFGKRKSKSPNPSKPSPGLPTDPSAGNS